MGAKLRRLRRRHARMARNFDEAGRAMWNVLAAAALENKRLKAELEDAMTVGEIMERIDRGETVRIPARYLGDFLTAASVQPRRWSCNVESDGKVATLSPAGGAPAEGSQLVAGIKGE
jgi:exoribonuclease II